MSNDLMLNDFSQLPAFLGADLLAKAAEANQHAMSGIKIGSFPRISIAGGKFFIVEDGEKKLITDPNNPQLPVMQLECVIIGSTAGLSKTYYEGEYQPGDDREPDCSSEEGVAPDGHIKNPQNTHCATCPKNAWGSKISPQGKEIKACSDGKRLAIVPANDLSYPALGLTIPPASLKSFGKFVQELTVRTQAAGVVSVPIFAIVTQIRFDPMANFPKLEFGRARWLSAQEMAIVQARVDSPEVKAIISPRASAAPAIPIAVHPIDRAVNAAVQAAMAPTPVPAPAPAAPTPQAMPAVDAAVNAAANVVTASFGASPTVDIPEFVTPGEVKPVKRTRAKKEAVAAPAEVAVPAQQAAPAAVGVPEMTPEMAQQFAAFLAQQAAPAPAPAAVVAPAVATVGFATAPAAAVASTASELDALLSQVMGGAK